MDDVTIKSINERLDRQSKSLEMLTESMDSMRRTVEKIAVQDEKIKQLQAQSAAMWQKVDRITANDGVISQIQRHQASCPREQIKTLWLVMIPMGLALLGMGIEFIVGS